MQLFGRRQMPLLVNGLPLTVGDIEEIMLGNHGERRLVKNRIVGLPDLELLNFTGGAIEPQLHDSIGSHAILYANQSSAIRVKAIKSQHSRMRCGLDKRNSSAAHINHEYSLQIV